MKKINYIYISPISKLIVGGGLLTCLLIFYWSFYALATPQVNPEVIDPKFLIESLSSKYPPVVDQNDVNLIEIQTTPKLIDSIKEKWLHRPSIEAYNFTLIDYNYKTIKRMHDATLQFLKYKKNGFFVEAGAYNGVSLSNTLHLEMNYNWTGLLVEPDPNYFQFLESAHRKSFIINACLALEPFSETMRMTRIKDQSALTRFSKLAPKEFMEMANKQDFEAQCFPFTSILAAALENGPLVIDYLSLDIEEAELDILKTIPFDFVYIKVMTVETYARDSQVTKFLKLRNFRKIRRFVGDYVHDNLYVNQRFLRENLN